MHAGSRMMSVSSWLLNWILPQNGVTH